MRKVHLIIIIALSAISLSACFSAYPELVLQPVLPEGDREIIIVTPDTSAQNAMVTPADSEQVMQIPLEASITSESTGAENGPIHLKASYWVEIPQVPVLMYHRFDPQTGAASDAYTTSLADFEGHLNALYDAGFSLVSLSDWLQGDINLPKGKRPLIITLDDLYYGDQISLDANGNPASYSGIGLLWEFYKSHPDFNFQAALFFNLGDKLYANDYTNGVFTVQDGWRKDRARVIAWGIEHGAMPYNHFYHHPFLNTLTPSEIAYELEENDRVLREDLAMLDKGYLADSLLNIIALPYVVWPATNAGTQVLFDYVNPEGAPMMAIMEGDYADNSLFLTSPFSSDFDPFHVPRISVSWEAINKIIARIDELPKTKKCDLGDFPGTTILTPDVISNAILTQYQAGQCSDGYYSVAGWAFILNEGKISQISQ
jgi:hypothetical protein